MTSPIDLPEKAEHELKVPVINREEYTVSLERASGLNFIHCDVHKPWSKTIRFELYEDFRLLLYLVNEPIHALHRPEDKKHEKFLNLFGFTYLCDFIDADGEEFQLYRT